jgi:hypothetical protein
VFKAPKVEVNRINLKPLISQQDLERISPERILRGLQQSVLKRLRTKILGASQLSNRAKKALYNGMVVRVGPRSITVVATHPAFKPLLQGQKSGQMTWLTKARAPIPIVTDTGEVIFRSASPRSMENGSWYHPGREPTTIIERARKEAREAIRENVAKDLRKQIRAAVQKATK